MPRRAWLCRALSGLALLVLPAWAIKGTAPLPVSDLSAQEIPSLPYLRVLGPFPLRFQEVPLPPPDLVTKPVAGGPPQPSAAPAPVTSSTPAASPAVPAPTATAPSSAPAAPPAATPPAPILPDETRPRVQPEDFLPFFQPPAAPVDAGPPAANRPLPSSATYRTQ